VLLLLATAASPLFAERLAVRSYGTADGLPSERIHDISQDSRGFLWFATADGLSRFDGYEFITYGAAQGLPDPVVNAFLETRDGGLWVATSHHVCRLRPAPEGSACESISPAAPTPGVFIPSTLLEDSAGNVWCGVGSLGLFRIEPSPGRGWMLQPVDLKVPPPFGVITLIEDRNERGVLWAGANTGLYRRRPDGRVDRIDGIPGYVEALIQDRGGRIWAGTRTGLYSFLPGPAGAAVSLEVYRESRGLANSDVKALLETSDGHIWAGSLLHGITEFTPAPGGGYALRTYGKAHGLSDETVISLAEDRAGNLWAGSESGGAMKIVRRGFTMFTRADGLGGDRIGAVFEDRAGELYVSTAAPGSHLNRWNGHGFESLSLHVGREAWGLAQAALQDRKGEWWTARDDALYRLGGKAFEQLRSAAPAAIYRTAEGAQTNYVSRLFADSRGGIWVSTGGDLHNHLSRWARDTGMTARDPPMQELVSAFAEDAAGNIWVGSHGEGVARYRNGEFTSYRTADGVPAGFVSDLFVDHAGRLWIASGSGGLGRVDEPDAARPVFVSYSTSQGLSSNSVFSITEDRWGRIYAGTRRGVDRLDLASGRIKHFTAADGLPRGTVYVAYRDRRDDLWFGAAQGLARLSPERDEDGPPPAAFISAVRAGNRPHLVAAPEQPLELGPDENFLQVNFSSPAFGAGEQLRYQYRLEGSGADWSAASTERSVVFSGLPHGRYRFLVRAVNSAGQASPAPAVVAFTILPQIAERWWFRLLAVLAAAGAIYGFYRYRMEQLLAMERIRTRIATDLHDDVGASLSQIAVLSDLVRRRSHNGDTGQMEPLHRIAGISRELVDSMSDIVWAISPQKDRLIDLTRRMRQFAEEMLVAPGIEFWFDVPARGEEIKLNVETRRQVFLIFKEGIHNVVRHANCTRVRVRLALEGDWLSLAIEDNGRGVAAGGNEGHGIPSMRSRAAALGGSLELTAGPGGGTIVALRVPARARLGVGYLRRSG
jgi:ligand-binding sensor domain-containing protein/signal transduction histidine kinase